MVIDCHYHLEERVFKKAELLEEMDRAGIARAALMGSIIAPFPEPPKPLLRVLQFILETRQLRGIGKALVANFTPKGEVKILGKPFFIVPDPDNDFVFNAVREHPDRFLGWVFVNPKGRNDQVAEFEKYKDEKGFIGVKAHPFWHHFTPVELLPVAERLAKIGKPLLIHCGYGEEGKFGALLKQVPDLKLILAHTGFPGYSDTWKAVLPWKNVTLDLSQTSYVSERATREAVAYLGADRLIFGTDGPYGFHDEQGRYDYGFIKRRIEKLFPEEAVRRKLLGDNFANLVSLS
ncbi:MAG TPA: TatD family hydrolase [Deltaproteobacteria bacterium]|nr:TatD family hydrolase [Deltaproteobacteria bacterium]